MRPEDIDDFLSAAQARGLAIKGAPIADGKRHRCDTSKKNGKSDGVYCLHSDGVPAGWFENHQDGFGVELWRSGRASSLSPAERIEAQNQVKAAQARREAEGQRLQHDAARRAAFIWDKATDCPPDHPYIVRKMIRPHIAKAYKGAVVVPLYNAVGGLSSLQFIATNGDKKFLTGGQIRGRFCVVGETDNDPDVICIGEGFATMASVFEMTGYFSVAAFNAGNLVPVVAAWRKKLPAARIVITADCDDTGIKFAKEAARGIGNRNVAVVWPDPEWFKAVPNNEAVPEQNAEDRSA